jgi:asparagine synthase (glutamine-hydrolysing)
MCGIAGYISKSSDMNIHPDLKGMVRLLTHRGPDDEGYYQNTHMGMGIRRLSIIDLKTGRQPITNEDETVWVVFNGEIYNYRELRSLLETKGHRFTTRSDTEVLVHGYEEWGEGLPKHLRGMFAFAIYDQRPARELPSGVSTAGFRSSIPGHLFLARDHFGVKPLYYAEVDGTFLFASEIKSILALPEISREIDPQALCSYLSFLYVPEPRTIFKAIRALPPAHSLTLEKGRASVRQYWKFQPSPNYHQSHRDTVDGIRAVFEDSVQAMLVSDVPLGLFLSGGIDSASILAMMCRHVDGPVKTFSIGFGAKEKHWDELDAARRVASFFRTDHHEFRLEPDVVGLIPQVVRHFDQPFANPTSVILYLLSGETRQHVKVALAGTGGDEMFAGYPRYVGMCLYQKYRYLPAFLRQGVAALSHQLAHDSMDGRPWPQRVRRFLEGGAMSFEDCYVSLLSGQGSDRIVTMFTPEFQSSLNGTDGAAFLRPYLDGSQDVPELEQLMLADLNTYLPYNQLVYGDRMSMAQSLEVRVPFVDQHLVDLARNIPLHHKIPWGVTKGLFREAMAPFLPREVINAPKKGLNLPISLWLREDLREWMHSLLSAERVRRRGYLRPEAVKTIIEEHERGRRDNSLFIWALLILEKWHELYIDGQ